MTAALAFMLGIGFALTMVGCCMAVEVLAKRGERIHRARFRDHAKVSAIHWSGLEQR